MAGQKATNKAAEASARKESEDFQKKTLEDKYLALKEPVDLAIDHCATEWFQKTYKKKRKAVIDAWKRVKKTAEMTPEEILSEDTLKPMLKDLKELQKAQKQLDEFVQDILISIEDLQEFCKGKDLFKKTLPLVPKWDHINGTPKFVKFDSV